jgi:hypothetical protein
MQDRHETNRKITELNKKLELFLAQSSAPSVHISPFKLPNNNSQNNNTKQLNSPPIKLNTVKIDENKSSSSIQIINVEPQQEKPSSTIIKYPGSDCSRSYVPDNKKSWDVEYENYLPTQYTSKNVLTNINADNNLILMYFL